MGRPTKYTPAIHKEIVQHIKNGNFFAPSCRAAGISPDTGHTWRAWGEGKQTYGTHKAPKDASMYVSFAADVARALDHGEVKAAKRLLLATKDDWRAAEAYLARRAPERWGRNRVEIEHSGSVEINAEAARDALKAYNDVFDDLISSEGAGDVEGAPDNTDA